MLFNKLKERFKMKKVATCKEKVLIIIKERNIINRGDGYSCSVSSGLKNSASFIIDMFNKIGVDGKLVEAIDNNCIDRLLKENKPTICILEALWVVPSKIKELQKLHPDVKWVVRLHSETPFLALEGISMEWLHEYVSYGVSIAVNSPRLQKELSYLIPFANLIMLPNYYPTDDYRSDNAKFDGTNIDIGCFGAIRPLKNHMIQAIAAIKFADDMGYSLSFHINANRCEDNGDPVLKNIRALFDNSHHHLIEHSWKSHEEFLDLMSTIHISMQVSFSETFNIVSADAVLRNVPIVVSDEIFWAYDGFKTSPTDSTKIIKTLKYVHSVRKFNAQYLNKHSLDKYNKKVIAAWKFVLCVKNK
jgi:hypothetical protein